MGRGARYAPAAVRRAALAGVVCGLALVPATALADRPMGGVSSWAHELNQDELPRYRPGRLVYPPARWNAMMRALITTSGRNGLGFSGPSALPFPPLPLAPNEPVSWRNPRLFGAVYAQTGLRWDVAYEVWAARKALAAGATVVDPSVSPFAYTQRLSLLDPTYAATSLAEIRRIAPSLRGRPFLGYFQGSDEPMIRLPRGRVARESAYARRMSAGVARFGQRPPSATAPATRSPAEGLRWLAYNRWASQEFFALKRRQAGLIRRLVPGARIAPNDYGFIRGFVPWDYSQLGFADLVEADPYVSYAENLRPGRGRYNPGFAAKFLSDITGKPTRIILQGFTYAGYTPNVEDLSVWASQALRAGASDLSIYASGNPRFTDRPFYQGMLDLARSLRGTRLPDPPVDARVRVLYAMASEAQGQPYGSGDDRYLTSGDALYTAYGLLGEQARGAFRFDSDTRLARTPAAWQDMSVLWLPRADTLEPAFARRLVSWVAAGGTLVVADPDAFTRTPSGRSLAAVHANLVGATLGPPQEGRVLRVDAAAMGAGRPSDDLFLPIDADVVRGFATVPAGSQVLARFTNDTPAVISRAVGQGRVIAFSTSILTPQVFTDPIDAVAFVRDLHAGYGGVLDHPAWGYRVPGAVDPLPPPWRDGAGDGN